MAERFDPWHAPLAGIEVRDVVESCAPTMRHAEHCVRVLLEYLGVYDVDSIDATRVVNALTEVSRAIGPGAPR